MPVTPGVILTGVLTDLYGDALIKGTLVFKLCGYGSQIPRIAGTGLIAETAPRKVGVNGSGEFSIELWGNQLITPGNTYYTVQILDSNGNVIQTNAYQFLVNGTFDLSAVGIYTPNVPPSPPAPQPGSLYVVVPYANNPVFDAQNTEGIITFDMTLTGDVGAPTTDHLTPGQLVTFIIRQDAFGAHTFLWPGNVYGGGVIDAGAGVINRQTFVVDIAGNMFNISPMSN